MIEFRKSQIGAFIEKEKRTSFVIIVLLVCCIIPFACLAQNISTEQELREALLNGVSNISLLNDIELSSTAPLYINKSTTINGNEKRIFYNENVTYEKYGNGFTSYILFIIDGDSSVIINKTKIIGIDRVTLFYIKNGTIDLNEGVEVISPWIAIHSDTSTSKGKVILNTCSIHDRKYATYPNAVIWLDNVDLEIHDGFNMYDCSNVHAFEIVNSNILMDGGTLRDIGWKDDHTAGELGLTLHRSTFTFQGGTIENINGTAIFAASSNLIINGGNILNNKSNGIQSQQSSIEIRSGQITNNKGGGIFATSSIVRINGGSICNNGQSGISVFNFLDQKHDSSLYIEGGTIKDNTSFNGGNDIYCDSYSNLYGNCMIKISADYDDNYGWFYDNKENRYKNNDKPIPFLPNETDMYSHLALTFGRAHNITWNLGDGTVIKELYKDGVIPSYSRTEPTKSNCVFSGWNPEPSAITQDTTYTAMFIPLYKVSFNANGGSGKMDAISVEKESTFILPDNEFIAPSGMMFSGWQLGENSYTPGQTITISDNVTLQALWADIADTEQKIDIETLDQVPPDLSKLFVNIDQITEKLSNRFLNKLFHFNKKQIVYLNIKLMISTDGGRTWVEATKENFPVEGIRARLPFPPGTNGKQYRFVVSHMYTVSYPERGWHLGQIDLPPVTWDDDGLLVTFRGMSPVAIAWERIDETPSALPQTGDNSRIILWIVLLSFSAGFVIYLLKKKHTRK